MNRFGILAAAVLCALAGAVQAQPPPAEQEEQGKEDAQAARRVSVDATATERAGQHDDGVITLESVEVLGTAQSRYDSRHAETGTLIPKDVTDIPRSIEIIPEQLLLDQHARELEDVYRLVPNVVNVDGFGGSREDFLIRGFRRRDDIYRNGVRLKTSSRIDPSTVDNIQLIKGPVAEIGQMTPGGLVNIITKKPLFQRERHAEANFDEYGERQATIDLTGPLGDSERFAYRLTASGEDSETFRQAEIERQFLSSSLHWRGETGASANLNYEFSHDERPIDRGFVTVPAGDSRRRIVAAPVSQRFDAPYLNHRDATYHILEFDSSMPVFGGTWTLENKLFYAHEATEDIRAEVSSVSDNGVLTRVVQGNRDRSIITRFGRLQLSGAFQAFVPVELAAGVEYREQDEGWTYFAGAPQTGGTVSDPAAFTVVDNATSTPAFLIDSDVHQRAYGSYVQADLAWTDSLVLTLGGRYEFFDGRYFSTDRLAETTLHVDPERDGHLTRSAGIVWKAVPGLSLYASYAETFQSQNIYIGDAATVVLPPEEGRQYEVGGKWSGAGDKWLLTGALFDIRQRNVVQFVDGTPVLAGGIVSRGGEVSVVANPVKGLNLRGGAGFLDARIVSTNPATDGNRPRNTPAATASLWVSYEFQQAGWRLRGLGLGAGLYYVGNRYGDDAHRFELGDYTLLDAGIWYYLPLGDRVRMRIDLGVKNVADEAYFTASGGALRISVGQPRTFYGGIRLDF